MQRFLIPFGFAVCLLGPALAESGRGAGLASGFGADATPAEEALAAQPEPDGYFREMTGFWHGAAGLTALRTRWEGFAAQEPGFAVLAALISESEGKPEETLEKLRTLTGSDARWNEGRLLALLGREQEAVTVLSALVTAAEHPETGAAALIALTELDCIRGDFTKALQRTTAAWEARQEEAFRLRILERHLSLLVEAGREREFLDTQLAAARISGGDEAPRQTAERVLAVMADWFTAELELRELRDRLQQTVRPLATFRTNEASKGRSSLECGLLIPSDSVLRGLARQENSPVEWTDAAARLFAREKAWPEHLESWPLFRKALRDQPLRLLNILFPLSDPVHPLPPAAVLLAACMKPGPGRAAAELVIRAWRGAAGPGEVEALTQILIEAPRAGWERPGPPRVENSSRNAVMTYPSEKVIWNLEGIGVTEFYRLWCRLSPLSFSQETASDSAGRAPFVPGEWRPRWPDEGTGKLTAWAWERLEEYGAATPDRAALIASRIPDEGDRVMFAAICRQTGLLEDWCGDAAFVAKVPSVGLMLAAEVIDQHLTFGSRHLPTAAETTAMFRVAEEMGKRLDLTTDQVIGRSQPFRRFAPAREIQPEYFSTPVPHPLYGLPVCPSVERYRVLAAAWTPGEQGSFFVERPVFTTLRLLLGWFDERQEVILAPDRMEKLEAFATAHPLKRQVLRWRGIARHEMMSPRSSQSGGDRLHGPKFSEKILEMLALEEQSEVEWHLVYAASASPPARRKVLLDIFRNRSPLTAGFALPALAAQESSLALPRVRPAPEEVAGIFLRTIQSKDGRLALTPAGAGLCFAESYSSNSFDRAIDFLPNNQREAVAEILMKQEDPLAARMAVCLATRSTAGPASLLREAMTRFPDDPEIMLAGASSPSLSDTDRRAAFLRALPRLARLFKNPSGTSWCGISENPVWSDPESVRAILEFVRRTQPDFLPNGWITAVAGALTNPEVLPRIEGLPEAMAVLLRYSWQSREAGFNWLPLLTALQSSGHADLAVEGAAAVLALPREPLNVWRNDNTWQFLPPSGISRASTGWRLLKLAASRDPAALARRLAAASTAFPDNSPIALSALVAQSFSRPLNDADVIPLSRFSREERLWILASASQLLRPDRLPAALCREAWEAQAWREFATPGSTDTASVLQGISYLERLSLAGFPESIPRLLGVMLTYLDGDLFVSPEDLPKILAGIRALRLSKEGTAPAVLVDTIVERLAETPLSSAYLAILLQTSFLPGGGGTLPAALEKRIFTTLETAVNASTNEAAWDRDLLSLATIAVAHPPWRDVLRRLSSRLNQGSASFEGWSTLATVLKVLESGMTLPNLRLQMIPLAEGSGTLRWTFDGLLLPTGMGPETPDRPYTGLPAAGLAGKFNASLIIESETGGGSRIVGQIEALAASGEIVLSGLPSAGRLRVQLSGRKGERPTGEVPPISYNTLPVVLDTGLPLEWPDMAVSGWNLLSAPVALTDSTSWDVRSESGALPPGLALLLLDSAYQVCSFATLKENRMAAGGTSFTPNGVIASWQMEPLANTPANFPEKNLIRTAGPASHFALALPSSTQTSGMPRLTVQNWPESRTREVTGRLEVIRQWAMPFKLEAPALIGGTPLQAAFAHEGRLWLLNLETDQPPRTIDLQANETLRIEKIFRTGPLLHVLFAARQEGGQPQPVSSLLSLNPADQGALPPRRLFSRPVNVALAEYLRIPGVTLFYSQGFLDSVLTAEGNLLSMRDLPVPTPRLEIIRIRSATQLECRQAPNQPDSLLQWTNGTLELITPAPAAIGNPWKSPQREEWYGGVDGLFSDPLAKPPQAWQAPFVLRDLYPFDRSLAVTPTSHGLILLRKVPAKIAVPAEDHR